MSLALQRVCLISPHFPEYSLRLANGLAQTVEVLLFVDDQQFNDEFSGREPQISPGVSLRRVKFETVQDGLMILGLVRRFAPDILHFQEAAGLKKSVILAAAAGWFHRLKLALTVHDPTPHKGRDAAIARRIAPFRRYVRARADLIVVHGDACRAEYEQQYLRPGQELLSIDHGVILNDVALEEPEREDLLRLLFFGRMEAYKGLEVLVPALELVASKTRKVKVDVAGRGPELDRFEARLRALPGVSVYNGYVPPARLIGSIRAADAILLPYTSATQSGVLAGAFGNHRFVIASCVGGIPDVVTDEANGLLTPPGDAQALADAILRVANDPDLKVRLRDGARQTAEGRLNWTHIAGQLLTGYARVGGAS